MGRLGAGKFAADWKNLHTRQISRKCILNEFKGLLQVSFGMRIATSLMGNADERRKCTGGDLPASNDITFPDVNELAGSPIRVIQSVEMGKLTFYPTRLEAEGGRYVEPE